VSEDKKTSVLEEKGEHSEAEVLETEDTQESGPGATEEAQEESPEAQEESPEALEPEEQIATLEKKLQEAEEKWLRGVAEMDNLRKRTRRDVEEAVIRGRTDVLREILPAIDSIDLALNTVDDKTEIKGIVEGMSMVRKQFISATERFGLKAVESQDKAFDPNFHEAVAQLESEEHEAGQIVEEMRKGYLLGDRLLRAAMVIVSKGKPVAEEEAGDGEDENDVPIDDGGMDD
jgi:molecular chaperone GrpE